MDTKPDSSRPPIALDSRPTKKGHRGLIIVGGVAAVVLVTAVAAGSHSHAKKEQARRLADLQGMWGGLQGCVLGGALDEGESPASRFRRIQLNVVGSRRGERAAPTPGTESPPAAKEADSKAAGWPSRCASYATAIVNHVEDAPANAIELRTSMGALAGELGKDASAKQALGKLINQSWKDAKGAGLEAKPADPASCPKPVVVLVSPEGMSVPSGLSGSFPLSSVMVEPAPTRNVRFLVADPALGGGPVACSASGTPTTLVCSHLGGAIDAAAPALTLAGTTDPAARPWVFAGERGQLGIFRPSGTMAVHGAPAYGASVGPDDSAWLLLHAQGGAPNDLELLHVPLIGDPDPALPVPIGRELGSLDDATLVWNWIVLRAGPQANTPGHLLAHSVTPAGVVGPALDIGDAKTVAAPAAPDARSRFSACRSGSNLVVRLHGAAADVLTFFTGETWTSPVALAMQGGELTCSGNEAIVTSVSGAEGSAPVVEQSHCNASGCSLAKVAVQELLAGTDVMPRGGGAFVATQLDRKLLLVWDSGPLGGIRMRFSPAESLKATPDVVLFDTAKPDSAAGEAKSPNDDSAAKSSVTALRLLPATGSAILLLETTSGVKLLDLDASGKVTPLHTKI